MRKRNKAITIRLTPEEYALLKEKAALSGRTQQMFMIEAGLNGKITSEEVIEELKYKNRLLADIDRQLRGMGTNLNQMAHVANGQGRIPTADTLLQIADDVRQIKQEVNAEWLSTRQSITKH